MKRSTNRPLTMMILFVVATFAANTLVEGKGKPVKLALSVSIAPGSIAEGGVATGTVSHNRADTSTAVTITLTSSDTSEATVDANVTIPAGSDSTTFPVTTLDDGEADGDQTVTISVVASGFRSDSTTLTVGSESPSMPQYYLTAFNTLGGAYGRFHRVNKQGDAVGWSNLAGDVAGHAIYAPADANGFPITMLDLNDLLDPIDQILWELNGAYDLNERDANGNTQIVGWGTYFSNGDEFPFRLTPPPNSTLVQQQGGGYLYEDANGTVVYPTVITLLLPGSVNGTGFGINNYGDVVGDNWLSNGDHFAILYTDGLGLMPLPVDLGTDFRQVQGINDSLQITGEKTSGAFPEAYRYSMLGDTLQPLGVLSQYGNPRSTGWDINEAGTVVGESTSTVVRKRKTYSVDRAFRALAGGTMEDLGTLGGDESRAYGVNSHDEVVGLASVATDRNGYTTESAAFLYSDALGGMVNLESLIANPISTHFIATSISDNGVICGYTIAEFGQNPLQVILTPLP